MNKRLSAAPIKHSIVVEAPIERAFKVFTEDFGSFKPREHNLLAVPIAETVFEPRAGGNVYDRGVDGSECRWARVLAYEPPNRVLLSWDISPRWQIETDPDKTSEMGSTVHPRDAEPNQVGAGTPTPGTAWRRLGRRARRR